MNEEESSRLTVIDREGCLRLLQQMAVGRLAIALPDASPNVVPVNYIMHAGTVVFRCDPGPRLDAVLRHHVSFEVDHFDAPTRSGWSVLVRGEAAELSLEDVSGLPLDVWAGGRKGRWVRITPGQVTGRFIPVDAYEPEGAGYL